MVLRRLDEAFGFGGLGARIFGSTLHLSQSVLGMSAERVQLTPS